MEEGLKSVITPLDKSQNSFLSTIAIAKLLLLHIFRTIGIGIAIAKSPEKLLILLLILLSHSLNYCYCY